MVALCFFVLFSAFLCPHLPVGLVDDDKSEEPEKVADPENPLRFRGTKANDAGVGDKSVVVHVVAVEQIRQVGHASHRVVFNKIAKIDDSLGRKNIFHLSSCSKVRHLKDKNDGEYEDAVDVGDIEGSTKPSNDGEAPDENG